MSCIVIEGDQVGRILYPLDNSWCKDKITGKQGYPAGTIADKRNPCIILSLPFKRRIKLFEKYCEYEFVEIFDTVERRVYSVLNCFTHEQKPDYIILDYFPSI